MHISSISQTPVQTQYPIRSQVSGDVQSLETALQSGDLSTAQTSFADLQKLLQGSGAIAAASTTTGTGAATGTTGASTNPFLQDFQTLGQDLSAGNLAGAQKDFAQLQSDATQQVQAGGHHHHHHFGTTPPEPATPAPATVADTPSTTAT